MAAEKTLDFTNFASDLLRTTQGMGNIVLIGAMMDGVAALRNDFSVRVMRDKGALVSVKFLDAWKAASDTFEGRKVADMNSRAVSFTEGDIDIEIKNSDVKEIYRSYLGWIMEPTRTEKEVRDNPFELFFIRQVIANHFAFIRTKTAWKGALGSGVGAGNIADGLLVKLTAARTANKIASSHVFEAADTIDEENAYAEVNGVAELVESVYPELLSMPLNCYLGKSMYKKYCKNRRVLFDKHVGPNDKPTTLDDFDNITFVIDPGLASKNTVVITPKENLVFAGNEEPGNFSFNAVRAVKSTQISIRVSLAFDFATPDFIFLNDAV